MTSLRPCPKGQVCFPGKDQTSLPLPPRPPPCHLPGFQEQRTFSGLPAPSFHTSCPGHVPPLFLSPRCQLPVTSQSTPCLEPHPPQGEFPWTGLPERLSSEHSSDHTSTLLSSPRWSPYAWKPVHAPYLSFKVLYTWLRSLCPTSFLTSY